MAHGSEALEGGLNLIWGDLKDEFHTKSRSCSVSLLLPSVQIFAFDLVVVLRSLRRLVCVLLTRHRSSAGSSLDPFIPLCSPGGMREQEMSEIKLHGVTKLGLKNIIDFIYTSKVSLDMGNLQDTLEAANFLQVMPVLRFCNRLLIREVRLR